MSPLASTSPTNPSDIYQERCTTDDTPAFAATPPSVSPSTVTTSAISTGLSPSSTRKCEGCKAPHPGTYGSGRFCSATCAKKVGAKQKWAARTPNTTTATRRATTARHPSPDAPCESCSKLHNKSYGSGRFCSVHCARRVAATRKWEKSRNEKSKRLEAIRPAMLALPPHPTSSHVASQFPLIAGKRRRVIGRHLEQLHISDTNSSFYLNQQYSIPQRLDMQTSSRQNTQCGLIRHPQPNLVSSTHNVPPNYLSTHPLPSPVHYAHASHISPNANLSFVSQPVVYSGPAQSMATHLHNYYSYPGGPPYSMPQQNPTQMDTSPYSTASPSTSPDPDLNNPQLQRPSYPPQRSIAHHSSPSTQPKKESPCEIEAITTPTSPAPSMQQDAVRVSCSKEFMKKSSPHVPEPKTSMDKSGPDTSESAAQALLCLRATNS